ncbi:MAG: sterol desaturase family protein [Bacteroidota bacterium]
MKKLYVSNKDESVRMFKSNFLEMFSKVHWSVPLFIFLPAIGYLMYLAITSPTINLIQVGLWFVGGIGIWTVTEYVLHRWLFHYEPPGKLGKRMHFIFHGVHHDYPNDSKRLVMPPAVSIPLASAFYFLFRSAVPHDGFFAFFAGFLAGYLFYDMLHYAIHHAPMKGKIWMALKTHHLKHHFKNPDAGYGVSSPLWDLVVGSDFESNKEKKGQKQAV